MLGKLQRRAAVADRKVGLPHRRSGTTQQLPFQPAVRHVIDEEERTRAELNRLSLSLVDGPEGLGAARQRECDDGTDRERGDVRAHDDSCSCRWSRTSAGWGPARRLFWRM